MSRSGDLDFSRGLLAGVVQKIGYEAAKALLGEVSSRARLSYHAGNENLSRVPDEQTPGGLCDQPDQEGRPTDTVPGVPGDPVESDPLRD